MADGTPVAQLQKPTDSHSRRRLRPLASLVPRLTSGDLDLDARPASSRAVHLQPAAERFDSISETGEPRPEVGVGAADAIISNREPKHVIDEVKGDPHTLGVRVL